MRNIQIFAIEGAAFSGKTTLLNYLRDNYSDQLITIPEASEYVGGDKNFPDVPFKTLSDAKASTHFFIELEKQRCVEAVAKWKENGLPILIDRTTPVSSLIFYSLLRHTNPNDSQFIDQFYQHALSAFNLEVRRENLIIPSGIIYIKPKNQEVFESRLGRGAKNGVFSSWGSFQFLDNLYKKLLQEHFKNNNLILESDNSEQSLQDMAIEVVKYINTNKSGNYPDIFDNFLNENRTMDSKIDLESEYLEFSKSINRCKELITNTKKYE